MISHLHIYWWVKTLCPLIYDKNSCCFIKTASNEVGLLIKWFDSSLLNILFTWIFYKLLSDNSWYSSLISLIQYVNLTFYLWCVCERLPHHLWNVVYISICTTFSLFSTLATTRVHVWGNVLLHSEDGNNTPGQYYI